MRLDNVIGFLATGMCKQNSKCASEKKMLNKQYVYTDIRHKLSETTDISDLFSYTKRYTQSNYSFCREIRDKRDIRFLDNGTRISYKESKAYVFEPSMSNGTEGDTFTNVNLPIIVSN